MKHYEVHCNFFTFLDGVKQLVSLINKESGALTYFVSTPIPYGSFKMKKKILKLQYSEGSSNFVG